ncbi:MAG: PQQ-dependent sugar dehydrogenase [Candidatus Pacearchaeota archaeon]
MKIKKKFIFYAVLTLVAVISIFLVSYKQNLDSISFELIAEGFNSPVKLVESPDGTGRLFVVDRIGIVKIIQGNETVEEPFLDLREKLVELKTQYDERGLLGFAFHPDFETNEKFYVYYSVPLRSEAPAGWDHTSRISEFSVSKDDSNKANIYSEKILLQFDEPQLNHNGGELIFGPDNYLYISSGDGGNADDFGLGHSEIGNAQDTSNLLGKILKINVNGGVAQDNPFVGKDGRDEIYAYGLRNPFRMSFDEETGKLFVADVGQNLWEEIDIVEKGKNYGWNIKEGTYCFSHESPDESPLNCSDVGYNDEELIEPILEYNHSVGLSVIGGFVYRGTEIPELYGKYIFGDWSDNFLIGGGKIFIAEKNNSWNIIDSVKLNSFLLGFGEDEKKELYILTTDDLGPIGNSGKVYKIIKNKN